MKRKRLAFSCRQAGFLMSLEAAAAFVLLLAAIPLLHTFQFKKASHAGDFFLCSDVAMLLTNKQPASQSELQEIVEKASGLSGLCIAAEFEGFSASSCSQPADDKEKVVFSFPVWQGGGIERASVGCFR
ncbi:MAG: hypothetical protein N3G22_01245 [Candidatus Micrarchaeota archaeon]|nr:hypothetical protein [Candidatus Micrarchaeota archaeon]